MANTNVFTGADGSITLSTNSAEGPEAATAQAIIDGNDLVAVGRATGVRVEVNTAIRAFNEIGQRYASELRLGNVAIRTGKAFHFDGEKCAADLKEAAPLIRRTYRKGWDLIGYNA